MPFPYLLFGSCVGFCIAAHLFESLNVQRYGMEIWDTTCRSLLTCSKRQTANGIFVFQCFACGLVWPLPVICWCWCRRRDPIFIYERNAYVSNLYFCSDGSDAERCLSWSIFQEQEIEMVKFPCHSISFFCSFPSAADRVKNTPTKISSKM